MWVVAFNKFLFVVSPTRPVENRKTCQMSLHIATLRTHSIIRSHSVALITGMHTHILLRTMSTLRKLSFRYIKQITNTLRYIKQNRHFIY